MNIATFNSESPLLVTTVGDLVVAVMDAALEVVQDERKAYQVAGLVVNGMLRLSSSNSFLLNEPYAGRVVHEA